MLQRVRLQCGHPKTIYGPANNGTYICDICTQLAQTDFDLPPITLKCTDCIYVSLSGRICKRDSCTIIFEDSEACEDFVVNAYSCKFFDELLDSNCKEHYMAYCEPSNCEWWGLKQQIEKKPVVFKRNEVAHEMRDELNVGIIPAIMFLDTFFQLISNDPKQQFMLQWIMDNPEKFKAGVLQVRETLWKQKSEKAEKLLAEAAILMEEIKLLGGSL